VPIIVNFLPRHTIVSFHKLAPFFKRYPIEIALVNISTKKSKSLQEYLLFTFQEG